MTLDSISIWLSVISVFVAFFAGLPVLVQFYTYRFMDPPINIDIHYEGKDIVDFSGTGPERIEWWRLDQEELANRKGGGMVPMLRFNNMGAEKDVYLDKVEVEFKNSDAWDVIPELSNRVYNIADGRFVVDPSVFYGMNPIHNEPPWFDTGFFPQGHGVNTPFPFEPEPSNLEIVVKSQTSIEADQISIPLFGPLPRMIGRIKLKPTVNTYRIKSDENETV